MNLRPDISARAKHVRAAFAIIAGAGLALSVACGSTVEQDPTPITTQPITPAAPRTVVATATPEPAATTDPNATPSAGTTLTVVADNIEFDTDELDAPAGSITFILDNQDTGVPHNIHIYKGDDADGESMGKTPLKNGDSIDEITLTLEAGEYFFVCDAHPNMKGTLTVT